VAERTRVVEALRGQGWFIPDTEANFVWFGLGERSAAFAEAAQEAGLTVRRYGDDGVRATIGETEANDVLIKVAGDFLSDNPVNPS
jgi:histidinol-phosphate aminotransferase